MTVLPSLVKQSLLIPGLYWVHADRHDDARGSFSEVWRKQWIPGAREWVQQNRVRSMEGTLRGLHFHMCQRDLWRCESGRIFCAFADLRQRQPVVETGWLEDPRCGVYIPEGVAHGYCAVGGPTVMTYQVDRYYDMDDEHAVNWNDPTLAIDWPAEHVRVMSARDQRAPILADVSPILIQTMRDFLPR